MNWLGSLYAQNPYSQAGLQNCAQQFGADAFNVNSRAQMQNSYLNLQRMFGAPRDTRTRCDYCGLNVTPEGYKCKSCGAPK